MLKLLKAADAAGKLPIDVVAYPLYKVVDEKTLGDIVASWRKAARYRTGGIKLAIDGSIQGYTAYLSKPYHVQPKGSGAVHADLCESDTGTQMVLGADPESPFSKGSAQDASSGHRGYANMTLDETVKYLRLADKAGVPVLAHTNGDAATDLLIEAVRQVRGDQPRPELRTVIIHAQTMREDQLNFAANNGLVPSFFPIHVQFWVTGTGTSFSGPSARRGSTRPARRSIAA